MLAKDADLICGSHCLPWKALYSFISCGTARTLAGSRRLGLDLFNHFEWPRSSRDTGKAYRGTWHFLQLLSYRRYARCSDPRNHVVTLLALADGRCTQHFVQDRPAP